MMNKFTEATDTKRWKIKESKIKKELSSKTELLLETTDPPPTPNQKERKNYQKQFLLEAAKFWKKKLLNGEYKEIRNRQIQAMKW